MPVRRQSEHLADYRAALEKLTAMGLVYPAFESRAEIARLVAQREARAPWPRDPDGTPLYPGAAKSLSSDERARDCWNQARPMRCGSTWRRRVRRPPISRWTEHGEGPDGETGAVAARPEAWGDVILARKETPTSYHLSVVIDDALQGVTEVVRGRRPVLVDQRAPAAAASARPAAAGLPAPPPRARRRRAEAVEVIRGDRYSRTPGAGCDARRHPPSGRPALTGPNGRGSGSARKRPS